MAKQFLICKWILFDISNFAIIDKNNLECCCSSIAAAVVINERNLIKRCREESASTPVNNAIKTQHNCILLKRVMKVQKKIYDFFSTGSVHKCPEKIL